jgi:DNA adenine methylase
LLPLLKWAGGKRSLVKLILELLPNDYLERSYHEPFIGGGALFFKLEPRRGSVSDINTRLMNFYRVVRDNPEELVEKASEYKYNKEEYYRLRDRFNERPKNPVEDAALMLYLNKTGYNGLYRVNSKGEFNVPFGRYVDPTIVPRRNIRKASRILKYIDIRSEDFEYLTSVVNPGDFCYLDPPYDPVSDTANFTNYSVFGFNKDDQERLAKLCYRLDDMGVIFILSNSDTNLIKKLYHERNFKIKQLETNRLISSKVSSRNSGLDVLITNSGLP